MTQSTRRSRIAGFKQPFILGMLGSVAALGCGSNERPDRFTCPESPPRVDTDCSDYNQGLGCGELECGRSGTWRRPPQLIFNPPPPVECPAELPQAGTDCTDHPAGQQCGEDACGGGPLTECSSTGQWVALAVPRCNPVPPSGTECPEALPPLGEDCWGYQIGLQCGQDACTGAAVAECSEAGLWVALPVPSCADGGQSDAGAVGSSDAAQSDAGPSDAGLFSTETGAEDAAAGAIDGGIQ